VFAKYTVQALLLYLFNPKLLQETLKILHKFYILFSFWGGADSLPKLFLWASMGTSVPRAPGPALHHVNPLHCKMLGTHKSFSNSVFIDYSVGADFLSIPVFHTRDA